MSEEAAQTPPPLQCCPGSRLAHALCVRFPSPLTHQPQQLAASFCLVHSAHRMVEQGAETRTMAGGHARDWMLVPPVSALIKYSCFLCWFREKDTVGHETEEEKEEEKEEESIRSCEVQELQKEVQHESGELQELQSQRRHVQDSLYELALQKGSLEQQLGHIRQQCSQENQLILSLQAEQEEQQHQIEEYVEELARAREELRLLREEAKCAEERVEATRARLHPLKDSICKSHADVEQLQQKLEKLQTKEEGAATLPTGEAPQEEEPGVKVEPELQGEGQLDQEVEKRQKTPEGKKKICDFPAEFYTSAAPTCCPQDTVDSNSSSPLHEITDVQDENQKPLISSVLEKETFTEEDNGFESEESSQAQQACTPPVAELDFFHSDPFTDSDPFKDDLFGKADDSDLFSRDPFKGTDPFSEEAFFKDSPSDPFCSAEPLISADPDPLTCQLDRAEGDHFLLEKDSRSAAGMEALSSAFDNSDGHDLFSSRSNLTPQQDPFVTVLYAEGSSVEDMSSAFGNPFAPGGMAVNACSDPDPFSAVFESESFGERFAEFSQLSKSSSMESFRSSGTRVGDESPTEDGHQGILYVPPSISHTEIMPTSSSPLHARRPSADSQADSQADSSERLDRRTPPLPLQLGDSSSRPDKVSFHDPFSTPQCEPPPGDPQGVTGSERARSTLPSLSPVETL
ncbi:epidermal growth factor receptor substrate 15-like [Scleropages formosus]|uniref:Epidermal growth factor receptor substrate 15-like n=1 Tax=Scleropages formosus TaxID=113540 RepID=A0A8C9S710_SCLFO|nr:epidermal growth factor receptor substrate 15-like [Scleropages formosus]